MLNDVVVDANVLVHAQDPREPRFDDACAFINLLLTKPTVICVDPEFSTDRAKNRSQIGHEYLKHLLPGSLSTLAVLTLVDRKRVKEVTRNVGSATLKRINRLITQNKIDRTYLRVAINSSERRLVSHDHADFPARVRAAIREDFGVHVQEACECHPHL